MAKKALLKDHDNIEILPITRGELVLDSSGNPALRSTEFLATTSQPGLMSAEDKYKILNMQASSVANALTLKINNGSTEGTNLYTFNGSAAKTLNIVAGDNITLTPTAGALSISASIPATIDAYTKAESDAKYLPLTGGRLSAYSWLPLTLQGNNKDFTGLGFSNNGNTAAYLVYMGDKSWKLTNEDWSWDAYIIHSGNISSYLPTIPTVTDYYWANVKISNESNSTTTPTFGNINVSGNATATTFIGNLDGTYVNKLTGYTKATSVSAIATTDSLNTALGKLELKADTAYTLVAGAYDGDGTIENLAEILKVLEGIKDTETIKAIVGKYLPLTGGTIKNGQERIPLKIDTDNEWGPELQLQYKGVTKAWIGIIPKDNYSSYGAYMCYNEADTAFLLGSDKKPYFCTSSSHLAPKYEILHAGNAGISNGTITINGVSITPLTSLPDHDHAYLKPNVGIGTYTPVEALDVAGNIRSVNILLSKQNGNSNHWYYARIGVVNEQSSPIYLNPAMVFYTMNNTHEAGTEVERMRITSAGRVGINTSNPTTALEVAGDILSKGYYLKEASTVTPVNMFGWYIWQNTVQFTKRDTNNTYVKELLGINMTTETTTVTGTFKVSGNSTITGNLNIDGGTDTYRKISIGSETSGRHVAIHNSAGFTIDGTSAGRIAELSLYESSSRLGGIGVYSGGPIYIDSSAGVHKIALENLTTITKTLTVTKDWMDTGIKSSDLTTGTYAVQVYVHSSADGIWYGYWSGMMSWYSSSTNDTRSDEILLHNSGHAVGPHIYLRTIQSLNTDGRNLRLQIAASKTLTSASYTFKFKKLI